MEKVLLLLWKIVLFNDVALKSEVIVKGGSTLSASISLTFRRTIGTEFLLSYRQCHLLTRALLGHLPAYHKEHIFAIFIYGPKLLKYSSIKMIF